MLTSPPPCGVRSAFEVLPLKVVHRRHATGFERERELPLRAGALLVGRYQVVDLLGAAAFSRAVQALDLKTGALVCLKIIKVRACPWQCMRACVECELPHAH